ncbi:hypothetical protein [Deinococcus alpinitundrae]|uniref:hypothetical protein n=1 Tax=Deinococcus alpinitundrae TaxID=468913 RepID=UPI0013796DD0|nr:hypothetical protein [Deinococcus alpinitundrae]
MKRFLLPLFLLAACGYQTPDPAQQLTFVEAMQNLPFQLDDWSGNTQEPGGTLTYISGIGSVTPQEVVTALKSAGLIIKPENVHVTGEPTPPPLLPNGSPFRAELIASSTGRSGQDYAISVRLINTTTQALKVSYGAVPLNAVLVDQNGKAVFWATVGAVIAVVYLTDCPPQQPCNKTLDLKFRLNRFQPKFPVQPGNYTLKVFTQGVGVSGEGPYQTGQVLNFSLPPQTLTVLP